MTKLRISKRTPFNPNFIEETREMKLENTKQVEITKTEEEFCNQLKLSQEYYEYLELKLAYLKLRYESKCAEISLVSFQEKRNHPNADVTETAYEPEYYFNICDYYEECIKECKTEMKEFNKKDKELIEKQKMNKVSYVTYL